MIKAFITYRGNSVANQNAFFYDVGLWDDSSETPGSPVGWTGLLNMGSDIVAPYTNKKIVDGVIAQTIATALATYSISLTTADVVMVFGPQYPVDGVKAYEGVTARANAFPIFKSATVASGVAVFHLTDNGTSGGNALFPNGVIADSVNAFVSDATASYQMSYAFSNGNKTLTVTANKLTTANILTGLLGQSAANGAVVKLSVFGY